MEEAGAGTGPQQAGPAGPLDDARPPEGSGRLSAGTDGGLAGAGRDGDLAGLGRLGHGDGHGQHAIVVVGLDAIDIQALTQEQLAGEAALLPGHGPGEEQVRSSQVASRVYNERC